MNKHLSRYQPVHRRHLLQAAGVGLALPWLESMAPAYASQPQNAPRRMVSICTALGLYPDSFWPETTGKNYEATTYLKRLSEHRNEFTVLGGLQHEDQVGRQPHDSEMTWLTSARFPGMGGFRNSISVDQVAAAHYKNTTRYPSITLGTHSSQSQSYTDRGVMIPAETSPAALFTKLFLQGKPSDVAAQKRRLDEGKSILDELKSEARRLRRKTSSGDNHLLSDYFESVRTAERNIADRQGWIDQPKPAVDRPPMTDVHDSRDFIGRINLLTELSALILQTDSSRVVSIMIHNTSEAPKIKGVGVNHHTLSHHGKDEKKILQLQRIETAIIDCLDQFFTALKSRSEEDNTLLDNTLVLFGSNLGNANAHHTKNVPTLIAGGRLNHGQFIKQDSATPLSNLFVRLLNEIGSPTEQFGQSTSHLSW